MEGSNLNSYVDRFSRTIRFFAEANMNDLLFWHTMDVPGFNKRIADFFCTEYGIQTGLYLVEWFERKGSGILNLHVRLTGYIPSTYWDDSFVGCVSLGFKDQWAGICSSCEIYFWRCCSKKCAISGRGHVSVGHVLPIIWIYGSA
jgi:hypothetical protein